MIEIDFSIDNRIFAFRRWPCVPRQGEIVILSHDKYHVLYVEWYENFDPSADADVLKAHINLLKLTGESQ